MRAKVYLILLFTIISGGIYAQVNGEKSSSKIDDVKTRVQKSSSKIDDVKTRVQNRLNGLSGKGGNQDPFDNTKLPPEDIEPPEYSELPETFVFQAKIDWLSHDGAPIYQDVATNSEYEVRFGINSNSQIEKWKLYVNDRKTTTSSDNRGIGVGKDDGYALSISKTVSLRPGVNRIELLAKSSNGKWARSAVLSVTYQQSSAYSGSQEKRIALVVGNSNYKAQGMTLKNPKNDATDVAQKLRALGFDVISGIDVDRNSFNNKINEFGRQAQSYDVALFFYAGHGLQSKGVNFLIPTDAVLYEENEIADKCVSADKVLEILEQSRCKANILILDACRNNMFEKSMSGHRGVAGGGLAEIKTEDTDGIFIAYSTAPGKTANDAIENSRNSPYTSALLHQLDVPNLTIEEVFKNVSRDVKDATKNKQKPWTSSSFDGVFIFNK